MDPDVILCCDSFGMEETFYNLFLNACEAMPEGGTITVAGGYRRLQWSYAVSVTDTGKGIPEKQDSADLYTVLRQKGGRQLRPGSVFLQEHFTGT